MQAKGKKVLPKQRNRKEPHLAGVDVHWEEEVGESGICRKMGRHSRSLHYTIGEMEILRRTLPMKVTGDPIVTVAFAMIPLPYIENFIL